MKKFALFLLLGAISATAAQPNVRWISSTEAAPWQTLQPSAPAPGAPVIELDPATRYQVIDGFGGCFNDLGWQALLALQPPAREAALKLLFDPAAANFTLGRMPIGANDFSLKYHFANAGSTVEAGIVKRTTSSASRNRTKT